MRAALAIVAVGAAITTTAAILRHESRGARVDARAAAVTGARAPVAGSPTLHWSAPTPQQWLAERSLRYDSSAAMVATLSAAGWRHLPRESAWYADVLLREGNAQAREEAVRILHVVLSLQDRGSGARFPGLWPVEREAPLSGNAAPDINWAEFMANALLDVLDEPQPLEPALRDSLDAAVVRAVLFMQRRTLGDIFHNMHALQTAAIVRTAARLDWPALRPVAVARVDTLHELLVTRREWDEYNSPTYSPLALDALLRARSAATRLGSTTSAMLESSIAVLCRGLQRHYAVSVGELAGPHSRAYPALMAGWNRRDLVRMLGAAPGACGPSAPQPEPRVVVDTLIPARPGMRTEPIYLGGPLPVLGNTLITRDLAFGSASVSAFWAQHRPVIAYVGDSLRHGYVRVRVLRDGVDFAGAQWFAAQQAGAVLGAVLFATDGGTDHPQHPFDARSLPLQELRVRFEFGGALQPDSLPFPAAGKLATVRVGAHRFAFGVPFASVGDLHAHWEHSRADSVSRVDLVLSQSAPRFSLDTLRDAALVIALASDAAPLTGAPSIVRSTNATVRATWSTLRLTVPSKPARLDALQARVTVLNATH